MGTPTTRLKMDEVSNDGSFTIAQTNGMDRRQDRRGDRQDCPQQGGVVGADKRNCKQEGRQTRGGRLDLLLTALSAVAYGVSLSTQASRSAVTGRA